MPLPRKFLFDQSFDLPDPRAAREAVDEPVVTRRDLEAARDAGFNAGRAHAMAQAASSQEERVAYSLETITAGVQALMETRARFAGEAEAHALDLVRAVLQKALPTLTRVNPLTEIEALVTQCLAEAHDEPRLVLRVADGLFEAVQDRLAPLAAANGYAGKLVLLADAALSDGDCRVEWADGGAERDTSRLATEIDTILARGLAAIASPAPPPVEEKSHE
jgi:flagellar assembly protein FliH